MPRSSVPSGRITARDRARQRRRLDRPPIREADATDAMEAFLDAATLPREASVIARLDLDQFLHASSRIALPAHERLRQLAMFLEARVLEHAAIDRIYAEVVRLAPDLWEGWHSRSVNAKAVALRSSGTRAARWKALARRSLDRAETLAPDALHVRYSLGKWAEEFGSDDEALRLFERALEIDPTDGWSLLHRAESLHTLGRWPDAVRAYDAVPLATFTGRNAWLVDVVLEHASYCRLKSGDRVGALEGFERLMMRFEREPKRAAFLELRFLRRVADGELRVELAERVRALDRAPSGR